MNYTEKEIEVIKQSEYDRGRMEGVLIALSICILALITIL